MKRVAVLSALVLCGVVLGSSGTDAIIVTPDRYLTKLTPEQQGDLFHMLMGYGFSPEYSMVVIEKSVNIDRGDRRAPVMTLHIREEAAGEIQPLLLFTVHNNSIRELEIKTTSGDGNFTGSPKEIVHFSWGSATVFAGASSINEPVTLLAHLRFVKG